MDKCIEKNYKETKEQVLEDKEAKGFFDNFHKATRYFERTHINIIIFREDIFFGRSFMPLIWHHVICEIYLHFFVSVYRSDVELPSVGHSLAPIQLPFLI